MTMIPNSLCIKASPKIVWSVLNTKYSNILATKHTR